MYRMRPALSTQARQDAEFYIAAQHLKFLASIFPQLHTHKDFPLDNAIDKSTESEIFYCRRTKRMLEFRHLLIGAVAMRTEGA